MPRTPYKWTTHTPQMVEEALQQYWFDIKGLAKFLGVTRMTVYRWSKTHPEFKAIFDKVKAERDDRTA